MILSSRFYDRQDGTIDQEPFHDLIDHYGKFNACYFDNGSQYVDHQLNLSLAKLGINVRFAPLRSGKSKGKLRNSTRLWTVLSEKAD